MKEHGALPHPLHAGLMGELDLQQEKLFIIIYDVHRGGGGGYGDQFFILIKPPPDNFLTTPITE